ncbi:hypothetical protein [Spartinivicinus poritis]|uniref:Uncharacterized protein n=1 Tax=Spartinivicinus poritis TaxID=2994640 RepID=A0ABT5UHH9_9GAMM|nr:hypothetical protein [Spartinivicinus sp. A2-2]MDE1465858.1 hypothetical protein [Spartinivicinus sp. A2-2]
MGIPSIISLIRTKLFFDFIISLCFVFSGIWLVYIGPSSNTVIKLFGQTITSTDAGVTVIFLSALVLILVTQRTLKTMELLIKAEKLHK